MDDLIAFLRARLDEDEAAALPFGHTIWRDEGTAIGVILVDGEALIEGHITGLTTHIARHHPARALREVATKRRIVTWHAQECTCAWVDEEGDDLRQPDVSGYGCPTLLLLASIWSDHADYQQEWAL